jgi:exopolysaccharide biosynthesis polyprenyl glycosylphosphotransferase
MQFHQMMDACLFAVSLWLAHVLRSNPDIISHLKLEKIGPFDDFVWIYLILLPVAPIVLELQGYYNRPMLCSRATTAWMLLKGCATITLVLILAMFLDRFSMPRWVPPLFAGISFVLIFTKEELFRAFAGKLALSPRRRRFVLVGTADETARMRAEIRSKSAETIDIVAEMNLNETPIQRLVGLLHEHSVSGVIVSAKRSLFDQVEAAIMACELEGVEVWLVADFFRTEISRTSFDEFFGHPIMVFRTAPEASWGRVVKQMIDIAGAALALAVLALPLAMVALLVRLTSPGPVFFKQERSGLNGRPFTLYKFRTMVTNAEQLKHELQAMNEMDGPVFKVTNDPRITRFGAILRRFSIDEFPQFYNVLRGEMSLVGPRPLPVDEVRRFNDLAHRRRLSVKPGLTCLWQISGRNNVKDFKNWVRLDLEYIDNWSLWLDFKILCQTVPVVLTGAGAR